MRSKTLSGPHVAGAFVSGPRADSTGAGMGDLGRTLMLLGGVLLVVGALLSFTGRLPWVGRLPGDVSIERENFRFYFPLATSIVISIILSLLVWLFRR